MIVHEKRTTERLEHNKVPIENIGTPRREHEPADGILRDCILGSKRDGVSDETKAEVIDALQPSRVCVREKVVRNPKRGMYV